MNFNLYKYRDTIWRILTTSVKAGLYSRSIVQIKMLIDFKFKAISHL